MYNLYICKCVQTNDPFTISLDWALLLYKIKTKVWFSEQHGLLPFLPKPMAQWKVLTIATLSLGAVMSPIKKKGHSSNCYIHWIQQQQKKEVCI